MSLVHPVDAYSAARHDDTGFVGWACYQGISLGFHADEGEVVVWTPDNAVEETLPADTTVEQYLRSLDRLVEEALSSRRGGF